LAEVPVQDQGAFAVLPPGPLSDCPLPELSGEMVFWLGVWLSGLSAYQTPFAWLLSCAGFITIQLTMLGSTRHLELKQAERYGTEAACQEYVGTVPVLFPWVPLYSLENLKVYLG
jgi:steroid 5-alpha reductase family enzyme